ncbi:Origin recognition complex, subunit 1 [Malassezia sp. CBS 17886]|nr:Origin recognition complex, subunit 1 [Malassezia sp. CBS 17886]
MPPAQAAAEAMEALAAASAHTKRGGRRARRSVASPAAASSAPATPATTAIDLANSLPPLSLPARPSALHTLPAEKLARLSAHERSKRLLHVGATPESLPCREDQFAEVLECTTDMLRAGAGGCAYVCGVPGTGKTATVREVVRMLQTRMHDGALPPFTFVEINGMKLASTMQAYTELWSAVSGGGKRLHPRAALTRLSAHFSAPRADGTHRTPVVVLMDELDLFVTTRQDVIYNLFHWPSLPGSSLVVIAVANTMDLPERALQPKVASRLGLTRIPFMPYTDTQLLGIVRARLGVDATGAGSDAPATRGCERVFHPDALVFASKRVANVSGDARRMLDVCRRAVEVAEQHALVHGSAPPPLSIADIRSVLDAMARSGKAAHMSALPFHAKLLLVSMYSCAHRTGVAEVSWGDVVAHHAALCRTHSIARGGAGAASALEGFSDEELLRPLATLCALGLVVAVGAGAGNARAGPYARFLLAVQEEEAHAVLRQDDDARVRALF